MPFTEEQREALGAAGFSDRQIAIMEQYNLEFPLGLSEEEMKTWWDYYATISPT
jgi:hypothetical protein